MRNSLGSGRRSKQPHNPRRRYSGATGQEAHVRAPPPAGGRERVNPAQAGPPFRSVALGTDTEQRFQANQLRDPAALTVEIAASWLTAGRPDWGGGWRCDGWIIACLLAFCGAS